MITITYSRNENDGADVHLSLDFAAIKVVKNGDKPAVTTVTVYDEIETDKLGQLKWLVNSAKDVASDLDRHGANIILIERGL